MSEGKPAILIAEDQADLRRLLRLALAPLGCAIHETGHGDEVIPLVQTLKPALLLLDVMLPGAHDGYAICRAIKADPASAQPQVIILSARGQQQDIEAGRQAGADRYFVKPFSPLELGEHLRGLLASKDQGTPPLR